MCKQGPLSTEEKGIVGRMKAIVVAGTHSGVGKTSIAVGLMAAFRKRGLRVQPFKVGPDFLDPMHHKVATGRESYNLDGWMLSREANVNCFLRNAEDTDIAVIEGVMGLFDGQDGRSEAGSTAELAKWLGAPVLLVLDCYALARSAAALVHGYTSFDPDLNVAGVIFNKVGGPAHVQWLREAVETAGIQTAILGGVPKTPEVEMQERHLGLHMPSDSDVPVDHTSLLGDLVEGHLDLDAILRLAGKFDPSREEGHQNGQPAELTKYQMVPVSNPVVTHLPQGRPVRIGVARDEAFCFYYHVNLSLLREAGAELVYFSPLSDSLPHRLDGIYLGGGYPELHAKKLSENTRMRFALRAFAAAGGVIYGECGGLMYLSQSIQTKEGDKHPMCGVFPFSTRMVARMKMGYVTVQPKDECLLFPPEIGTVRGQVFHFSEVYYEEAVGEEGGASCHPPTGFSLQRKVPGASPEAEGFMMQNSMATYAHLHFASNPETATAFVDRCRMGFSKAAAVAAASASAVAGSGPVAAAAAGAAAAAAVADAADDSGGSDRELYALRHYLKMTPTRGLRRHRWSESACWEHGSEQPHSHLDEHSRLVRTESLQWIEGEDSQTGKGMRRSMSEYGIARNVRKRMRKHSRVGPAPLQPGSSSPLAPGWELGGSDNSSASSDLDSSWEGPSGALLGKSGEPDAVRISNVKNSNALNGHISSAEKLGSDPAADRTHSMPSTGFRFSSAPPALNRQDPEMHAINGHSGAQGAYSASSSDCGEMGAWEAPNLEPISFSSDDPGGIPEHDHGLPARGHVSQGGSLECTLEPSYQQPRVSANGIEPAEQQGNSTMLRTVPDRVLLTASGIASCQSEGIAGAQIAKRVVSLLPSATEIIMALGAGEQLVGVSDLCDYPQGVAMGRHIVSRSKLNASAMSSREVEAAMKGFSDRKESLFELDQTWLQSARPDLLFTQDTCAKCDVDKGDVAVATEAAGLDSSSTRTVVLGPRTMSDVMDCITRVGNAVGVPAAVSAGLVNSLRGRLRQVLATVVGQPRPRVVSLEGIAPLVLGGHWLPEMKMLAGGTDGLQEAGAMAERVAWERVVASAPEVLILAPCSSSPQRTLDEVECLAAQPGFWSIPAVEQGQVFVCEHSYFSRPGPRLVDGVELLAALLHPSKVPFKAPAGSVLKFSLSSGQRCRPEELHRHFQPYQAVTSP